MMEKRPLSLTIIMWFLIVTSLFGLYSVLTIRSNEVAMKMIEQMGVPIMYQQVWGILGAVVSLIVAYGIYRGQPWSRVLYVLWGILGLVVGYFISPMPLVLGLSLIFLIVISAFLFGDKANGWFAARGFALTREQG
jgi:hypothetical protein